MSLRSAPLTDPEDPFLVGRDCELQLACTLIDMDINVAMLGARGSGKTTLLHQIRGRVNGRQAYLVDASGITSPRELLACISEHVVGPRERWEPSEPARSMAAMRSFTSGGRVVKELSVSTQLKRDVDALRLAVIGQNDSLPVLILLDNVDASAARELFTTQRDQLRTTPVVWMVAVDINRWAKFSGTDTDFWDRTIELEPLSGGDASELLIRRDTEKRLTGSERQGIVDSSHGIPGELVRNLRDAIIDKMTPGPGIDRQSARSVATTRLSQLGQPAEMLVDSMRQFGRPVSASDAELLALVQWSRPRAGQVLNQLSKADLVVSFEGKDQGEGRNGRPRRLFQLAEAIA